MKKCSFCKEIKSLDEFGKCSSSKDGYSYSCKKCRGLISSNSYKKVGRKDPTPKQEKSIKEYKAKWFQENKDRLNKKELTEEQKENIKEYKARWFQENKERLNKRDLDRRNSDPKKKINHLVSSAVLKCLGRDKGGNKWSNILGFSSEELLSHFGVSEIPKGFHIDHIIPINAYSFSSINEEFLKCWNIKNLRIIPAKDNLSKGDKINKKLILEYNLIDILPKGMEIEDLE